jgi:hypothetical protein
MPRPSVVGRLIGQCRHVVGPSLLLRRAKSSSISLPALPSLCLRIRILAEPVSALGAPPHSTGMKLLWQTLPAVPTKRRSLVD